MSIETIFNGAIEAVENEAKKLEGEASTEIKTVETELRAQLTHAEVTAKTALVKDKIAVLDEINKANADALAFLEKERERTLADAIALKVKVEALLAKL